MLEEVRSQNLRKEIPWTSSNLVGKSDKKPEWLSRRGKRKKMEIRGRERSRVGTTYVTVLGFFSQAGGGLWAWGPFLGEGELGQNPIAQWTFSKYNWIHPCSGLT